MGVLNPSATDYSTMASKMNTKVFFAEATTQQFDFVATLYDKALRLKAESKSSKPENVIKLDKWYQNELPKKIKSRGKDAHLFHDELVQTIKWKLQRGKFRPNLVNLVQMNTPRVVMQDTKKAFRNLQKKNDLQAAANVLCNIKGVGPAMASAVLAAGAPHMAPFMADECLLAMPDVKGLDYTMREYMRFVDYVKACVERLNSQGGTTWTPHTVELAVWTHAICYDLSPELLEDMPEANAKPAAVNPAAASEIEAASEPSNNGQIANDEDTKSSMASSTMDEDSQPQKTEETESEIPPASEQPPSGEAAVASEAVEAEAKEPQAVAEQSESEEKSTSNGNTPKTNGNNSHNGSEVPKNGEEAEAKDNNSKAEDQPKNGELENGVKSNEESTDLSSQDKNHSTGEKRNSDAVTEEVEPAAKKLKTCEDQAPSEETTSESPVPPAPKPEDTQTQSAPAANPAPQVAVEKWKKIERKM